MQEQLSLISRHNPQSFDRHYDTMYVNGVCPRESTLEAKLDCKRPVALNTEGTTEQRQPSTNKGKPRN
jgi:hypothetical protein